MVTRPLGDTQRYVLWSMSQTDRPGHLNGTWYPGCGWIWGTLSQTERIMKSLEKRGLVTSRERFTNQGGRKVTYREYTITDEGRKAAGDPAVLPKIRKD